MRQWKLELKSVNKTISESAENIEDVNRDTLHRSPESPSQPVASEINEKDDQIDSYVPPVATVTESEQPIHVRETNNLVSRWKRLRGFLIDSLINMLLVIPIMLAIAGVYWTGVLQMTISQRMTNVAIGGECF